MEGEKANDGSRVDQWQDNDKPHQRWQLTRVAEEHDETFYTIGHPNSSMVMEAPGPWEQGDSVVMRLYTQGNGDQRHRQWKLEPVPGKQNVYKIVNRRSGFCIDIEGGDSEKGAIKQYSSWNAPDDRQHWRLESLDVDPSRPTSEDWQIQYEHDGSVRVPAWQLSIPVDGTVWAWGENNQGRLGFYIQGDHNQPIAQKVELKEKAIAVSAGDRHSLAVLADGSVWAWGDNGHGRLGIGREGGNYDLPQEVQGFGKNRKAIAVSAGTEHSLARG